MLLRENVRLTTSYIRRIRELGYRYIYIEDKETTGIHIEDMVPDEIKQQVVWKIKTLYDQISDPKTNLKIINSGELGAAFTDIFKSLFSFLKENNTFIINIGAIFTDDAFLYTHCMNVGMYSSILAMAHGYGEDKIQQLGVGAMLHDIGKLQINKQILDKPGKLTDEEKREVDAHCKLGYDFLRSQVGISAVSAHCALQHHEKFDGTGYPRRLKGRDIHEVGRITAVADVFDALTSNRHYRKAFLPHEAIEFLYANVGTHFDPIFVDLFIKHVNVYPIGMPVELSNGEAGVIAGTNSGNLQRPIVLVTSRDGEKVSPYELNLADALNVTVSQCDFSTVHS